MKLESTIITNVYTYFLNFNNTLFINFLAVNIRFYLQEGIVAFFYKYLNLSVYVFKRILLVLFLLFSGRIRLLTARILKWKCWTHSCHEKHMVFKPTDCFYLDSKKYKSLSYKYWHWIFIDIKWAQHFETIYYKCKILYSNK